MGTKQHLREAAVWWQPKLRVAAATWTLIALMFWWGSDDHSAFALAQRLTFNYAALLLVSALAVFTIAAATGRSEAKQPKPLSPYWEDKSGGTKLRKTLTGPPLEVVCACPVCESAGSHPAHGVQ